MMTKQDNIRGRITYKRFKDIAGNLIKFGVPDKSVSKVLELIYDILDEKRAFRSRLSATYAWESVDRVIKDLKGKK